MRPPTRIKAALALFPPRTLTRHHTTYYSLFPLTLPRGPPPQGPFPINTRHLRNEFLRLQATHHPDKAGPSPLSSTINEAYRTLSSPLLRAQYLLSLRGVDVLDEAAKVDEQALLAVVLDAHEIIEEATHPRELEALTAQNEERIRESERMLDEAFSKDELERAAKEAARLRYWVNIREAVRDWEEGKPAVLQHGT